ncbi:MAG: hypothetical protein RBU27_13985 [Bacteroidota bacterium]|jgi:hypothetical protein|nr:hypothetical protein [Bacteroidota bacterium]
MNTHLFSLTLMMLLAALLIRPCVNGEMGVLLPSAVSDAGCCRLTDGLDALATETDRVEDAALGTRLLDRMREVFPRDEIPCEGRRVRVIWSNTGGNSLRWNPLS